MRTPRVRDVLEKKYERMRTIINLRRPERMPCEDIRPKQENLEAFNRYFEELLVYDA
jgi:hypothetical protein